jgi:hypothetical protein
MKTSTLPGFRAEASLYDTKASYRSRLTQPEAGKLAVVAQGFAAPGAGLVVPAWKMVGRCKKDEEGHWECETETVM